MTSPNTTSAPAPISIYGYGMMAMSTTIAILLMNGFFQKTDTDLIATWFVVALSAASGALAVALVKVNVPQLRKPTAMSYITLTFIILLCSYITSFFGFSQAYMLYAAYKKPIIGYYFSFDKFMNDLIRAWQGVAVMSIISTIAYLIVQALSPSKAANNQTAEPIDIDERDGLAE